MSAATPTPNEIPASVLRDFFLIWLYCTVTCYDGIVAKTTTAASVAKDLQGKINDNEYNKAAIASLIDDIQGNSQSFSDVKASLLDTPIDPPWAGSGPHPDLTEIISALIPL